MPITMTQFSDEEMEVLAKKIGDYLLPILLEALKDKTRIAVNRLQGEHYTARQVAERLEISPQQVYRLVDRGVIQAEKVGKKGIRISRNELDKLLQSGGLAK
ncbi:MAG: helix-turn-helix domain-containing protein [Geobacteraceae bacterium]|nr:helix-turn-helix domain-containing protein [Geobacteraceae bacterium]